MDSHTLEEGLLSAGNDEENRRRSSSGSGRNRSTGNELCEDSGIRCEGSSHTSNSGGREDDGNNGPEFLSIDNMLVKYVGEFGWAQFWHFVLVCSAWISTSMYKMCMIFSDRVPEWECVAHGASPLNAQLNGTLGRECSSSSSLCAMDRDLWEWVGGRSVSTVSEWDLICGEEYKIGLVGALFFIGILLGGGIWGNFSDSFLGRRGTVSISLVIAASLGMLTSAAPNFWVYSILRFLTGLSASGISQCTFVLATEVIGPNKRGAVGLSAFYFFSVGVMILPLFGYFTSSWRTFYLAIGLFNVAYCLLALPLLHESPRWYLVKGRGEDAMKVLRSFAKWNGNVVPQGTRLMLDSDMISSPVGKFKEDAVSFPVGKAKEDAISLPARVDSRLLLMKGSKSSGTLVDVFRCRETRHRMLIMLCVWFSVSLVYYGISLNAANVGFNLYVSVFLNGVIEMPSLAITAALSGRLGRRGVLVGSMSLCSFCCLLGGYLFTCISDGGDEENFVFGTQGLISVLKLVCSVMGLFAIAGSYNVLYSYTTELFPTVVRNAVLGLGVQAAGIGSVASPVIAVLGRASSSVPFVIFGLLALTGAVLGSRLPETLGKPLWETMEGIEKAHSPSHQEEG